VIDDDLILSGANLSQEYFTDRQDRYLQIKDGGGGLVDFYCELIEILCQYSFRFQDVSHTRVSKRELVKSLGKLMDGTLQTHHADPTVTDLETENVVAYAVPTFQVPSGFSTLDFPMDAIQTRNLLLAAHEQDDSTCVQLASAYLNPTPKLVSTLSKFKHLKLLTAGYKSHGFAPKPRQPRRGDWVPSIFSALYAELEEKLPHAELLYYEREGWTFHAKGLWLTESTNGSLLGAVIGSGNYGARSEVLDVESNTILVFPHQETELQTQLMQEWTGMCQYAHEGHAIEFPQTSWKIKAALPMIRDLF
jgi:CDP-diacylglycerol--glycerol-3-phosphate 3-phosphatidyltransferase